MILANCLGNSVETSSLPPNTVKDHASYNLFLFLIPVVERWMISQKICASKEENF